MLLFLWDVRIPPAPDRSTRHPSREKRGVRRPPHTCLVWPPVLKFYCCTIWVQQRVIMGGFRCKAHVRYVSALFIYTSGRCQVTMEASDEHGPVCPFVESVLNNGWPVCICQSSPRQTDRPVARAGHPQIDGYIQDVCTQKCPPSYSYYTHLQQETPDGQHQKVFSPVKTTRTVRTYPRASDSRISIDSGRPEASQT